MVGLDKVKEFFIKRLLIPNIFRIDIPGYIITRSYSAGGQKISTRTTMIPERFIINLESTADKEMGNSGAESVYSIGKNTGYYFSKIAQFPKDEKTYSVLMPSFFGTLFADNIDLQIRKSGNKISQIDLEVDNPAALANRFSYFLLGALAGLWSYVLDDTKIECAVKSREENNFFLASSTAKMLKSEGVKDIMTTDKLVDFDMQAYYLNNKIPTGLSRDGATIKKLIDRRVFVYKAARLETNADNCRYLAIESSGISQIDALLPEDVVYGAAYSYFRDLGMKIGSMPEPYEFMAQLLTATGFGVVSIAESGGSRRIVTFNGYPWFSKDLMKTTMPYMRGAFAGFIKGNMKKDVKASFLSSGMVKGAFTLSIAVSG